ncbi:Uncharacterised protein [Chlamydia trachomatis]|nr:Uncharacterised protein [Chlamydia trachomatis]
MKKMSSLAYHFGVKLRLCLLPFLFLIIMRLGWQKK